MPTGIDRERLKQLADKGYSWPRIADHFGFGVKKMKTLASMWPDIAEKITINGKKKTRNFGNHLIGSRDIGR